MQHLQPPLPVESVVLESAAGMRVTLLNLGASIQSVRVPTGEGAVDVVLGFDNHNDYWTDTAFMGATVGRFANRIRGARFELGGTRFDLDANEAETGHCLHGGRLGFHKRFWTLEPADDGQSVKCRYLSSDRECGFPGNLEVTVDYQLVNGHMLIVDYNAKSDRDTVVSLSNHAYFNLDRSKSTIDTHSLTIAAARYTPSDRQRVPTGEVRNVCSSTFDLRRATPLRRGQSRLCFDHNFVLPENAGLIRKAAELYSADSGVRLRIHTTQPGLQLYTGDDLTPPFRPRQGLCLEPQAFPDAPNQTAFPSAQLSAGDCYRQRTVYDFRPPTRC